MQTATNWRNLAVRNELHIKRKSINSLHQQRPGSSVGANTFVQLQTTRAAMIAVLDTTTSALDKLKTNRPGIAPVDDGPI